MVGLITWPFWLVARLGRTLLPLPLPSVHFLPYLENSAPNESAFSYTSCYVTIIPKYCHLCLVLCAVHTPYQLSLQHSWQLKNQVQSWLTIAHTVLYLSRVQKFPWSIKLMEKRQYSRRLLKMTEKLVWMLNFIYVIRELITRFVYWFI